jgi:hypothetical protein
MSELERMLVALGDDLAVPATPDIAAAVAGRLEPRRRGIPLRRPLVLAFAAVVAAALLATLAIPDARSALLRFFGIGGVRIELVEELPEVPADPVELELMLGERVSPADAKRRAGFPLLELDEAPDAVYLGERGTVWFVYGRPDSVRLLIAQTPDLGVDEPSLFKKLAAQGTSVDEATVRGEQGFFLSGEPHLVFLVDENGDVVGDSARLTEEVLVWDEDGRTIRLEGDLTKEEALRLAESMRVRSPG